MLLLLMGGTFIHVAHYSEAAGLVAVIRQTHQKGMKVTERPKILVLSASDDSTFAADTMLHHLGASVRTVMETDDAARLLDIWRPNVLIVTHWTSVLGAWCRWLRGKPVFPDLPILVLGDHDGEQEALEVLDAGADAYLAQPFGTRLLVEQVQSFLDRSESWERRTIGDKSTICVDPVAHRIWVRGREVHVSQRMFRLVQYMAQHPDRVLSVPEISLIITGRNEILQPNTIAVHILRLRKTLKAVGADSWLETVHSFGYRLVIPQPEKIPPSSTTHGGLHEDQ